MHSTLVRTELKLYAIQVEHIPTVGSENFFGAWFSAWWYILSGHILVEDDRTAGRTSRRVSGEVQYR